LAEKNARNGDMRKTRKERKEGEEAGGIIEAF
jgi:hypothetical protein